MIPDTTKDSLIDALRRFDEDLRDTHEWRGWEQQESYKYAIEHEGRRYPVKQIVSWATNTPVSSFQRWHRSKRIRRDARIPGRATSTI